MAETERTDTVNLYCKNNGVFKQYPMGTSLLEIYRDQNIELNYPVMAARVNYKVESLNFRIYKPKNIEFIDASSPSGIRVYLRSISMVMAYALSRIMPEATLRIEHPISRGYYCCIDQRGKGVNRTLIERLREKMQEVIDADLPIAQEEQQTMTVIDMFRRRGQHDTVTLLETIGMPYSRYFRIDDYIDYYSGVLVPSTGYLTLFELESYEDGILLRVPDRHAPDRLAPYEEQSKMFDIFNEFISWNKLLGLNNVGDFNIICRDSSVYNIIKVSEALHEKKISQIADMILQQGKRFVLISGPSSSGKTTFSKRLGIQLMVAGIKPIVLSMDNYFVNRVDTPLDENGDWDFESIHALDLELLNANIVRLLAGDEIELPFFDFEKGERYYKGTKIRMNPDNVLVMEGIHALNPQLTHAIPQDAIFKVYVSALTTISLDNHNWVSTTDTRLLRRIVRDYKFRGYSARDTISRWPSVRRGEEKWIFPYQENADVMFNSALLFELAVLRKHAEPILEDVPQYCDEYTEAHRLLKFLKYFTPIHDSEIPPTSLLREFLGGSSFQY